jgi:hypothetical protein
MKMTKCRSPGVCYSCKGPIQKGDMYRKRSHRVGSSQPDSLEMREGTPTIVMHGWTVAIKLCAECANQAKVTGYYPPVPFNLRGL